MTLEESRKFSIFPKGPMVWGENFQIFLGLFFFKLGLNIRFAYLQERKQPCLNYKNDIIKKSKYFWSKFNIFS